MKKKMLKLSYGILLLLVILISVSCKRQTVVIQGVVKSKCELTDLSISLYSSKLQQQNATNDGVPLTKKGTFKLNAETETSYILEISGPKGTGRIFIKTEALDKPLEITYPVIEKIVILHTSDRHFDWNKEQKFAALVQKYRDDNNDVFLFDAGDVFVRHAARWNINGGENQDSLWYEQRAIEMIEKMNEAKYDLLTVGNHELAYIKDYTKNALLKAQFPILGANVELNTENFPELNPYVLLKTSTMRRIFALGLSTDNTGRDGVKIADMAKTVDNYLHLKDSSDIFLAVTHIGIGKDSKLAEGYSEFDLIIGGHSHTLLTESILVDSVLLSHAGGSRHQVSVNNPAYFGAVTITLQNGKIVDKQGKVIQL